MATSREAEARTRVAIVGAGYGRYVIAPAFQRDARCEIVAVCARSQASAARAAAEAGIHRAYTDPAAMLDAGGIDAVAIATPPDVQPFVTKLALARSLPVFVEKLLALSLDEARLLAETARTTGVANVVDYIFPELDAWRFARTLLEDGFIGSLRHVTSSWMIETYDNRHGAVTWKTDPGAGGGALHHFGPHVLHYLEWLMGPIERLGATLSRAPDARRPGDTAASLSLSFASGAAGAVALSTAAPLGSGHRVEIYGSLGTLMLVNDTPDPVIGFRLLAGNKGTQRLSEMDVPSPRPTIEPIDSRVEPASRLAARFIDWVRTGVATRPSFSDGLRVQALLDAAARSSASGSTVVVFRD